MQESDLPGLVAQVLWAAFALALVFGAIAQRTHFCTMGAVADIVNMGDWTRMRMWLLAMGVAMIGFNTLVWLGWVATALGQRGEAILRTAEEVRRLSTEEAARGRLVELEGVITFFGPKQFSRFLQDASAGIYLTDFNEYPELKVGDEVKLRGRTDAGEYAPVVRPEKVERVGRVPSLLPVMPEPEQ